MYLLECDERGESQLARHNIKGFMWFVPLLLIAVMFLNSPLYAEEPEFDYSDLSLMAGVSVMQTGSTGIVLEVKGSSLPAPSFTSSGTEVVLTWPKSYIPSLNWTRDYSYPLVRKISMNQTGEDLRMVLEVTEPLEIREIKGTAPSNFFKIYLDTRAQVVKKEMEALPKIKDLKPVRSNDPFLKNTPVNMELRDVELRDVFRMFGEIINMNIIADPSVPDAYVTMTLKGVPLHEAFGYLMKMYDVNYAIMGRTIIVGTADSIGKTLGREKTMSYQVAYAEPSAVAGLLQGLAGVSKVVVDERLKTIYVTAREEQFIKVREVLQRVDNPGKQVMLQARIVEVTDSGQKDLQNSISAVYRNWQFSYSSGGLTNVSYFDDNTSNETLKSIDATMEYLQSENKGKVLASPTVVTINGEEAEVKLIRKLKYQSGIDDNGNPLFSDEEIGPTLTFTPLVGRDNMVTIDIEIETGDIIGFRQSGQSEVPETTERTAETMVRVRQGEPFIIGGLFQENDSSSVTQVPLLSQIPLLGELFKSTTSNTERSEVIIIVIPYILDTPDIPVTELELS